MTFQKGDPGGPGRPPIQRDFKSRCLSFMSKDGWPALTAMATDPKHPNAFAALQLIANYAYGKPTQPLAGDPDSSPISIRVIYEDGPTETTAFGAETD